LITGDQEKAVATKVNIIATDRKSLTHDLSSIIDVECFSQLQT